MIQEPSCPVKTFLQATSFQNPTFFKDNQSLSDSETSNFLDVSTHIVNTSSILPKNFMIENPSSSRTQLEVVHADDEEFSETTSPPNQIPSTNLINSRQVHMFTIDDLPISKWRERFQEFEAWVLVEMQNPNNTPRSILINFASRVSGTLYDWWRKLGEYRQLEILNSQSTLGALVATKDEFCSIQTYVEDHMRK